jgi:hypothetical protein
MPVGISINESALSTATSDPTAIDRAYMLGTSTSTTINTAVIIKDLVDFNTKFAGAPAITVASVRSFFRNHPEGNLYFVSCKDPAVTGTASDPAHFVYALSLLSKSTALRLGYLVIPEIVQLADQAARTSVYAAAEGLCQKLDWIHFTNTAIASNTKDKATTERMLYASSYGHSALYYGFKVDPEGQKVPLSVVAVAIALLAGRDNAYRPPSGARYPIQGAASFDPYVDNINDFEDLRVRNINVVQYIQSVKGFCLWGARTLASDPKFGQINTRVAISLITVQMTDALTPLLFESSDPQGYTKREVIRIAISLLESAYQAGGLSGESSERSYRIDEVEDTSGGLRRIQIKIYARFIDTLEFIEIQLINTDVIPVG